MSRFLVVPQWQGSPASRAMLLSDGAAAIAGDLPRDATTVLDVPLTAGESLGSGIQRLSALLHTRALIADALREHPGEPTVIIGGDCGVSVAALSALAGGVDDVAVIWCDAHPDLHTPQSSPSGAFSGMALRAVMGEGHPELRLSPGVEASRVVLVGARAVDETEHPSLAELPLHRVHAEELSAPDAIVRAAEATGASRVYVHIDVDVLDPAEISGVSAPAPFGATTAALSASLRQLRERMPLAGAAIAGFAPATPLAAVDDLGALLRLIATLA